MDYEHIRVAADGPTARITLARAERRNALSLEMMREIVAALGALPTDAAVVVIAAEGPVFSAGHDLGEMIGRDTAFFQQLFDVCTELMETIHRVPMPVIAKVDGMATAAGCQLVAACDLAVASDDARFATSGINFGLFCATPGVPVSRNIAQKRAFEMLFTGEFIDAATARAWGLVNRVVPAAELDAATQALAAAILAKPRDVVAAGKAFFYRQLEAPLAQAYAQASDLITANMLGESAQEGVGAFVAKRPPNWKE